MEQHASDEFAAPGSVLEVRDETWLVLRTERAGDEWFVEVQGLSPLVRGTTATFFTGIDDVKPLDPASATVRVDLSAGFRDSRLWLEATHRKTAVPLAEEALTVATRGLLDPLPYQEAAVRKALDPANLRPRILLADAVGLGKTLEIGMILSELVRRGRGERILVVTPRHVLEQMQFELWTRFALPFVRLDSVGIQRIRQQLPANRNPFAYFKRAIISIDTLKSDKYLAHLEKQQWDAVVIDESHNVTNEATLNHRLASLLSSRTESLILASATPHNGKKESFASLIRMLDPSAVTPSGDLVEDEVRRMVIRRHRHSPDVASVVGADWAERQEPHNVLVAASPAERAIAEELEQVWLHPTSGSSPYSGANSRLFPWTLAKAFLSSPAALLETVRERQKRLDVERPAEAREIESLEVLASLAQRCLDDGSAKFDRLVAHLKEIGVGPKSDARVVVFAERVKTLSWLRDGLAKAFKLKDEQIRVLHGGVSDVEQQEIVEAFKAESSPLRVLVTGDVASEGVNLHLQCHELVHYDIPWSLIRIEQRNGRIDRYGQRTSPRITTLLLDPATAQFGGDLKILQSLVVKEHEAHKTLGDSASLIGTYDVKAEEDAIREVLMGAKQLDDVVRSVDDVMADGGLEALLASLSAVAQDSVDGAVEEPEAPAGAPSEAVRGVYDDDVAFLRDALTLVFQEPGAKSEIGGVEWREHPNHALVEFAPSDDLKQRLSVLPQTYLRDRGVKEKMVLATSLSRGNTALVQARGAESFSLWPAAHYLSPLHPSLEWASDRALESLQRNEIFAVVGSAPHVSVVLHGMLTNHRGQVVSSMYVVVQFPQSDVTSFRFASPQPNLRAALAAAGFDPNGANRGDLTGAEGLDVFVAPAVEEARGTLATLFDAAAQAASQRVETWTRRAQDWESAAAEQAQRLDVKQRRVAVSEEAALVRSMAPDQHTVRPLLVVVPESMTGEFC